MRDPDPNISRSPLSASAACHYRNPVQNNRIAFQGEPGAYSEEALFLLRPDAVSVPCREFRDVVRATQEARADYGLLPIENSLVGSIATNYDLIAESGLAIVGEVVSPVHHCLLAVRGTTRDALRRVLSHPVALAQCERFLSQLAQAEIVAFYDTAGAAAEVARRNDPALGAVAGALAARRYGLEILVERIEDEPHNQTRFLLVAPHASPPQAHVPAKTTLRLRLPHRPGTLAHALAPFAEAGLNLTKLESRPDRAAAWQYLFYLDVEARVHDPAMQQVLAALRAQGAEITLLGDYPRFAATPTNPGRGA
ncbi:MAG TPA: prephenate dehydratase [Gemmatimonadales bacterium]|nr:prephenate dehydratase [Gemmatimonadales bacterium]